MSPKKAIKLKTPDDIKRIAEAGKIISEIFRIIKSLSLEGLSTFDVDEVIENYIHKFKARASFKTVSRYNYASCISVNDEVVHGVPSKKKIIKKGDIVKVDIGVVKNGYFADSCYTMEIDRISNNARRLLDVTMKSLELGIETMYPAKRIGDIGSTIQNFVERNGYSVVRDFTGHGVGFAVHEPPNVPHYGRKNTGRIIEEGMVIAVEPMVNEGKHQVITMKDGWTTVTADGKLSAQYEHTIAVTKNGPLILTEFI